jgi:hypothetical protein
VTVQQKPILHGRDHAPGGADPIRGLGALEWEDLGTTAAAAPSWLRHVTFFSNSASVLVAGGPATMIWNAAPVSSYDPAGDVAERDGAASHIINLKSVGTYALWGSVMIGRNVGAPLLSASVPFELDGTDINPLVWQASLGVAVKWPDNFASGPLFTLLHQTLYSGQIWVICPYTLPTPVEMALCVAKIGP